jgi:hypothetical protein
MKESDQNNMGNPEDETPQVFNLSREGRSFKFTRREFIQVTGVVSTTIAAAGCARDPGSTEETVSQKGESTATRKPPTYTQGSPDTSTPTKTRTPTKTPGPTRTPTPVVVRASTKKQGINVRTGPGTFYYAIGSLAANVEMIVIARLADSSWLNVLIDLEYLPALLTAPISDERSDVEGWIRADLLNFLEGSIDTLPVAEPPPTPTPLPNESPTGEEGITYKYTDLYGTTYTYTLPCGSPIPAGAICTCNCVSLCSCDGHVAPPTCTCDKNSSGGKICTCNLVTYWYPN